MNILFANLPSPPGKRLIRSYSAGYGDIVAEDSADAVRFPPLELLRMAAVARAHGHCVTVVDLDLPVPSALPEAADLVVTTASLPTYRSDAKAAKTLAERFAGSRLLLYSAIVSEEISLALLQQSQAEALLRPDGIGAFADIAEGKTHAGTIRQIDGRFEPGPSGTWPGGLDNEPPAARDLLDHTHYVFSPFAEVNAPDSPITTVNASYGCPYPCGYYCPYPASEGRRLRSYGVPRLLDELLRIQAQGIKAVVFRDPLFSHHARHTEAICEGMLAAGFDLPWWCETRISCLSEDLLKKMAAAGCVGMEVGVESGDETVLAGGARKQISPATVRAFDLYRRRCNVFVKYLFMIGLPGETRRSIVNTLDLILDMDLLPSEFNISTITPYPGTKFYDDAVAAGWIERGYEHFTGYSISMRTSHLTIADLEDAQRLVQELYAGASLRDREWKQSFLARCRAWADGETVLPH